MSGHQFHGKMALGTGAYVLIWVCRNSGKHSVMVCVQFCLRLTNWQPYCALETTYSMHPLKFWITTLSSTLWLKMSTSQSLKGRDMSRHDLALAQESCRGYGSMSLLAMSLGDWFCVSRKGGTGGRWVGTPRGWKQHGCVWADCENFSVGPFLLC